MLAFSKPLPLREHFASLREDHEDDVDVGEISYEAVRPPPHSMANGSAGSAVIHGVPLRQRELILELKGPKENGGLLHRKLSTECKGGLKIAMLP